jgi:guanylate kinase
VKKRKGLLVVVSSPSGGGKTTVIHRLLAKDRSRFTRSVSMTTRPKRPGEKEGRDYYFVENTVFADKIKQGELIEYERIHGYDYGTPKQALQAKLEQGPIILMAIDVKGALSIRKIFPDNSLLIFLQPPNLKVLRDRLIKRGTETIEEIDKRMARVAQEIRLGAQFDSVIVNHRLADTVNSVRKKIFEKLNSNESYNGGNVNG